MTSAWPLTLGDGEAGLFPTVVVEGGPFDDGADGVAVAQIEFVGGAGGGLVLSFLDGGGFGGESDAEDRVGGG